MIPIQTDFKNAQKVMCLMDLKITHHSKYRIFWEFQFIMIQEEQQEAGDPMQSLKNF